MNKCPEPEKIPKSAPSWFRSWHNSTFWHFKYGIESKLATHDKLLWIILTAIIVAAVANVFL